MFWIKKKEPIQEVYIPVPSVDHKLVLNLVNQMIMWRSMDICVFNEIKRVFNIDWTRPDLYDKLRTLHCVNWDKMDDDVYLRAMESIKELMRTAVNTKKHNKKFFTFDDFANEPNWKTTTG